MLNSNTKNRWISTLCSTAIHLLMLLILAVSTIKIAGRGEQSIIASLTDGDETILTLTPNQPEEQELSAPSTLGASDVSTSLFQAPRVIPELELGKGAPKQNALSISDIIQQSGKGNRVGEHGFVDLSLSSRTKENRKVQGAKNGATEQSEAAVERCLAFLARNQENNGSWATDLPLCPDCTDTAKALDNHRIASTGLALLCFLGAGHTMTEGEYNETVRRGVYFLVQALQYKKGDSASQGTLGFWLTEQAFAQMYEHGIATLALTEALQMSGENSLKEPCQATVNFICSAQHKKDGGWDYHPRKPGDLSIVGWQVMALKSATSAKLIVPLEVMRATDGFLNAQAASNGFMYKYRNDGKPSPSMTSIGNLIRLFRGSMVTDPFMMRANEYLANVGPSLNDVYYNYYATQFMFHYGGPRWRNWNLTMRELLVHSQVLEGPMSGSWFFDGNSFNVVGGRLYTTTMSCLTLEVYYRHMPVYEAATDDFRL